MRDAIHEVTVKGNESAQSSLADAAISSYGEKTLQGGASSAAKDSSAAKFLPAGPIIVDNKSVDTTPRLKSAESSNTSTDNHFKGVASGDKQLK